MQPILLNQENLKSIAHKAREQVKALKGKPTYMEMLHILSVAAYGRPYEEALATVFAAPAVVSEPVEHKGTIFILHYGIDRVVMMNDVCMSSTCFNNEDDRFERLNDKTQQLAKKNGYSIVECHVPQVHGENVGENAIIALARQMGYFNKFGSIFNCFDGAKIFIDNMHCPCGLNSDWLQTIDDTDDEPLEDFTAWYPEVTDSDGNLFEYYVSFGELCNATTHDGKTWTVIDGGNYELKVEFCK